MNNCTFIGNIVRDAELKYTQEGLAIGSFTLAVSRGYGEKKSTAFLAMKMFGKRAESLTKYLTKGSKIAVIAEVTQNSWEKDGVKQYKFEFIVSDIELLGGAQFKAQEKAKPYTQNPDAVPPEDFEDDEIPF